MWWHDGHRRQVSEPRQRYVDLIDGGVSDLYFDSNVCHADLRCLTAGAMAHMPGPCPSCQSEQVINGGKTDTGKPQDRGHHPDGVPQSCLLEPADTGR